MTRSNDDLELILFGWLEALRRRDPARIVSHLADDIVWEGLRSDLVCPNRDAVVDNIRWGGQHRRRLSSLEVSGVDDQHVLLAVCLPGVTELYGETIAGEIFSVFRLRDGVIVRIDEFKTRDEALNALATATALDEPDESDRGDLSLARVAVQRAMVEGVVPILNVSDIAESFVWFEKLGWRTGFEWNPTASEVGPGFGSVESDGVEIFLCRGGQGGRGRGPNALTFGPDGDETADQGAWMAIWVDDVDAVYERCVTEGCQCRSSSPWVGLSPGVGARYGARVLHVSRAGDGGLGVGVGAFGAAVWAQREPRCHRWHVWRTQRPRAPAGCGDDWGVGPTGVREPRRPLPRDGSGCIALEKPDRPD